MKQQALDALRAAGICATEVVPDGKFHRVGTTDKPHSTNGSYRLSCVEGRVILGYQNWSTGDKWRSVLLQGEVPENWSMDTIAAGSAEKETPEEVFEKARTVWRLSSQTTTHPYLTKKGIAPHGARTLGESLVIPAINKTGRLCSLQFISADGSKRFLAGASTKGVYHPMQGTSQVFGLCEGFATGASINEMLGITVFCAFSAGNLPEVAETMRLRPLIVFADDDFKHNDKNPGLEAATKAAKLHGNATVVHPGMFRPNDWNDFANIKQALKAQLGSKWLA